MHTYIHTVWYIHYILTACSYIASEYIIVQLILQVPNNIPLPGRPLTELDQEEHVITNPPLRTPPKPDVSI